MSLQIQEQLLLLLLCTTLASGLDPNNACLQNLASLQSMCPSVLSAEQVSTNIGDYLGACPGKMCSVASTGSAKCIVHWNQTCHAMDNGMDSCCPSIPVAFDTKLTQATSLPWFSNEVQAEVVGIANQHLTVHIPPNTFSKKNASVVVDNSPDPDEPNPTIASDFSQTSFTILSEEAPRMPLSLRVASMPTTLADGCTGKANSSRAMLFSHDKSRGLWISIPNQTFSWTYGTEFSGIMQAYIEPQAFEWVRNRFSRVRLASAYVDATGMNSSSPVRYALPEGHFMGMQDPSYVTSMQMVGYCPLPVALDESLSKKRRLLQQQKQGLVMLGLPVTRQWKNSVILKSQEEFVLYVPRPAALALKNGQRRSMDLNSIWTMYLNETSQQWVDITGSSCSYNATAEGDIMIRCMINGSIVERSGRQLTLANAVMNSSSMAVAMQEPVVTTTAPATTPPATTASPTTATLLTTPQPPQRQEEAKSENRVITIIAVSVSVGSFIVLALAASVFVRYCTRQVPSAAGIPYQPLRNRMDVSSLQVDGFFA